jgi:hypothetical protein
MNPVEVFRSWHIQLLVVVSASPKIVGHPKPTQESMNRLMIFLRVDVFFDVAQLFQQTFSYCPFHDCGAIVV